MSTQSILITVLTFLLVSSITPGSVTVTSLLRVTVSCQVAQLLTSSGSQTRGIYYTVSEFSRPPFKGALRSEGRDQPDPFRLVFKFVHIASGQLQLHPQASAVLRHWASSTLRADSLPQLRGLEWFGRSRVGQGCPAHSSQ